MTIDDVMVAMAMITARGSVLESHFASPLIKARYRIPFYNAYPISTSLYPMCMLELNQGSPLHILFKEQRKKEDLKEEMSG